MLRVQEPLLKNASSEMFADRRPEFQSLEGDLRRDHLSHTYEAMFNSETLWWMALLLVPLKDLLEAGLSPHRSEARLWGHTSRKSNVVECLGKTDSFPLHPAVVEHLACGWGASGWFGAVPVVCVGDPVPGDTIAPEMDSPPAGSSVIQALMALMSSLPTDAWRTDDLDVLTQVEPCVPLFNVELRAYKVGGCWTDVGCGSVWKARACCEAFSADLLLRLRWSLIFDQCACVAEGDGRGAGCNVQVWGV
jgi:hypothetical protein